jgi:hypothetical protein
MLPELYFHTLEVECTSVFKYNTMLYPFFPSACAVECLQFLSNTQKEKLSELANLFTTKVLLDVCHIQYTSSKDFLKFPTRLRTANLSQLFSLSFIWDIESHRSSYPVSAHVANLAAR